MCACAIPDHEVARDCILCIPAASFIEVVIVNDLAGIVHGIAIKGFQFTAGCPAVVVLLLQVLESLALEGDTLVAA